MDSEGKCAENGAAGAEPPLDKYLDGCYRGWITEDQVTNFQRNSWLAGVNKSRS